MNGPAKETEMRERNKESKDKEIPIPISDTGCRKAVSGRIRAEDFFSAEYDAVDLVATAFNGTRKDRRLWRKYLRNGSIEEAKFLELAFDKWREDQVDGRGDNPAACFQAILNPHLSGNRGRLKSGPKPVSHR